MRPLLRYAWLCLSALSTVCIAQETSPDASAPQMATAPAAGVAGGTVGREALAAYVDGVVQAYLHREGIAGATVAVVDRSGTVLERGYGVAAFSPERPVDPATTLFRIGSTTKTFTYIATMQLVEQGKLSLDDDVNKYLPERLRIPDAGYGPVRVWNLMTHTAGFEDSALGHLIGNDPARELPLEDYLAQYRPARVRPTGLHADYSNYSVALLGDIVARVSGQPFEDYVEQHLFAPLGMTHTTLREPLPAGDPRRIDDAAARNFSTGFQREAGGFTAKGFEYIAHGAPAGAGSSTAADMARYMRMLLGAGTLDGVTVLKPETFAAMRQERFSNAPGVAGFAHGFFMERFGEYTGLGHGGATLYFHTGMTVLPGAGIGVFVSANTDNARKFAAELPRLVFEYALPLARPTTLAAADASTDANLQRFAGRYLGERRSYSTVETFLDANGSAAGIASKGGELVLSYAGSEHRYRQTGPLTFRAVEDDDTLAFVEEAGSVSGFAFGGGHVMFTRAGWSDDAGLPSTLLGVAGLCSLLVLVAAWARRGLVPRARSSHPVGGRAPAAALVFAAFGWLLFLGALGFAALGMAQLGNDLVYRYPTTGLRVAVGTAYFAAGLSVVAALFLPGALTARGWGFWRKLRYLAVVLVMLATVLLLARWKFIFAPFFPAG